MVSCKLSKMSACMCGCSASVLEGVNLKTDLSKWGLKVKIV